MKKKTVPGSLERLEQSVKKVRKEKYILRLYVTGTTPKSVRAITNIKEICEQHLKGRYDLEVIDLYKQPELARGEQIIAAPTLIRKLPLPLRRIIGDMSSSEKVLVGLNIREVDNNATEENASQQDK